MNVQDVEDPDVDLEPSHDPSPTPTSPVATSGKESNLQPTLVEEETNHDIDQGGEPSAELVDQSEYP